MVEEGDRIMGIPAMVVVVIVDAGEGVRVGRAILLPPAAI